MLTEGALFGAGGLGGLLLVKFFDWFKERKSLRAAEGGAAALIEGLTKRVQDLEAKQTVMDARLAEEMKLRLQAQEDAIKLRTQVALLTAGMRAMEQQLKAHGITPVVVPYVDDGA